MSSSSSSSLSSSSSPSTIVDVDLELEDDFETLLASARPFLRGELEAVDPNLPSLVSVLRGVGAGQCWHKHGTFIEHLFGVYRILKLWKAQDSVCRCGLFHSAYSNSYVNLAIFDPSTGRDTVCSHVGDAAEELIYLFCVVNRHRIIHDDLVYRYTDAELVEDLKASEVSLRNALKEEGAVFNGDEPWRKKLNSLLPPGGITVKHIRTGEDVFLSRRVVAIFVLISLADFSDQFFGFFDALFENSNGRFDSPGNRHGTLWPGDCKPGLWLNLVSKVGAIYSLLVREEEIFMQEKKMVAGHDPGSRNLELVIPPIFDNCTKVVGAEEQIESRDLYWEAVCDCDGSKEGLARAEEMLRRCIEKNPFMGEPHVVLGQIYLTSGRFEEAERAAEKGLRLMLEWGCQWDKRMSWEEWVAWSRILLMKAKEKSWPNTSWGILNLGLVK